MPISEEQLTRIKLYQLTIAFEEQSQAYHILANIANKNRHCSRTFEDCNEETCLGASLILKELGI